MKKELKMALDDVLHIKGVCGVHNMHVWKTSPIQISLAHIICVFEEADKISVLKSASDIFHVLELRIWLSNL
jgi:Co/Zn/Cd efflux system component